MRTCSRAREKPMPKSLGGHMGLQSPRDANNLLGLPHLQGSDLVKVTLAQETNNGPFIKWYSLLESVYLDARAHGSMRDKRKNFWQRKYPLLLCTRMAECARQAAEQLPVVPSVHPRLQKLLNLGLGQQTLRQ